MAEAHPRSVWQVLSVYLVGCGVSLQVVGAVTDSAGLPDWTPGFAFVLMLVGLPIVLATAIVQEGAPGAAQRDEQSSVETGSPTYGMREAERRGEVSTTPGRLR